MPVTYCQAVRDTLILYRNTGRILMFAFHDGTWANFHSGPRYIDVWTETFGPPGFVRTGTDAQGNGLFRRRRRNTLEAALIHEGIHAHGQHTHPQGQTFPRELVQRCMDPTHTDWVP